MTRTNHSRALTILAAMTAAALAAGLLLALVGAKPASAAFPGQNGKIVFSSNFDVVQQHNSNIYTVNPDGTDVSRLTSGTADDRFPSFSPDAQKITFDRTPDDGSYCSQIYVMDSDGSNLTSALTSQGCNFEPAWGPGGKIAFTSTRNGNDEIYVMDSDGSNRTRLTNDPVSTKSPAFPPTVARSPSRPPETTGTSRSTR